MAGSGDNDITLTNRDYGELINLALLRRPGWIPAGPVDAAKRRPLYTYQRANTIAKLIQAGYVDATRGQGGDMYSLRLTEAGKNVIRAMPDELLREEWFPLACDIAEAKARLSVDRQH